MKKAKYLKAGEVAHHWAHETSCNGGERLVNTGGGWNRGVGRVQRQSFVDGALYSYGTVIARIIKGKGGKSAFVLETKRFSVTTSKHQCYARRAIPEGQVVFYVNHGLPGLLYTPQTLCDHYAGKFSELKAPAKHKATAARQVLSRAHYLREAIKVATHFKIARACLVNKLSKISAEIKTAEDFVAAYELRLRQRREAKEALARERRRIREAAAIASAIKLAEGDLSNKDLDLNFGYQDDWLESRPDLIAKVNAERERRAATVIADWIAGKNVSIPYSCPCKLRQDGNELETSKGVRVPLADAEKAFRFIACRWIKGWHRNGETFAIGDFQLDSITPEGIVAGCHRITRKEIERFAKSQGWIA